MPTLRKALGGIMLVLAFLTTTAPMAHVLELPNKFTLDGPSWLLVQQQLYRGWGAVFGPIDIAAILVGILICVIARDDRPAMRRMLAAVAVYFAMVVVFFLFNAPVNAAFNSWTVATLRSDWPRCRMQWEIGHALSALLSIIGLVLVARARLKATRS